MSQTEILPGITFNFENLIQPRDPKFAVVLVFSRSQFHQRFTRSFNARRSQKCKKIDNLTVFFYTFGIFESKSCAKNVDEIEPKWSLFIDHLRIKNYFSCCGLEITIEG